MKVLLVVLLLAVTYQAVIAACPPEKPYSLSSVLCYKSCQDIPFGFYKATDFSFNCYSVPKTQFSNNTSVNLQDRLGPKCPGYVPAMFFSWVVYENNPRLFTGAKFSSNLGYKRLVGCGEWEIVNEVHLEGDLLNSHVSFIVNNQSGVLVVAFEGTEMSPERWKQSLVDWVFNDFYTSLVTCKLSPECADTKVHAGFQRSVMGIRVAILEQIKQYIRADYVILFTGHSKGAAMSTMATAMARYEFRDVPSIDKKIYNLNFGSPRVGNADFAAFYNRIVPDDRTARYIDKFHNDVLADCEDVVTTVPPTWLGYKHVKNGKFVTCERKWFGNPDPIPGIHFQLYPEGKYLPSLVGCHFQETYMDGLLYGPPATNVMKLMGDEEEERVDVSNMTKNDICMKMCTDVFVQMKDAEQLSLCSRKCRKYGMVGPPTRAKKHTRLESM